VALLAVAFTCSRAARAANDCPWLNEATAAGILDGNATGLYVAATPDKPGSCTFTEIASGETHQLIIVVEVAASPHQRMMALEHACTSPSEPLAAIGNEAVHCAAMPRGKPHGELIIGRVRDQVFTIAITSTAKNDPVLEPHELAMRSQTAAEEVSGNLF
jgi:hypothetical protein